MAATSSTVKATMRPKLAGTDPARHQQAEDQARARALNVMRRKRLDVHVEPPGEQESDRGDHEIGRMSSSRMRQ